MWFEWDEEKSAENWARRSVDFGRAVLFSMIPSALRWWTLVKTTAKNA